MNYQLPKTIEESKKLWAIPLCLFGLAGVMFLQAIISPMLRFKSSFLDAGAPVISADNGTLQKQEHHEDGGDFEIAFNQTGPSTITLERNGVKQTFQVNIIESPLQNVAAPVADNFAENNGTGGYAIPTPAPTINPADTLLHGSAERDLKAKQRRIKQLLAGYEDVNYLQKNSGAIAALIEIGIMKGRVTESGKKQFNPSGQITRAEMTIMIARWLYNDELTALATTKDVVKRRMAKESTCQFNDIPKDAWYQDAMLLACKHQLLSTESGKHFNPSEELSYADALRMILDASAEQYPETIGAILNPEKESLKPEQKWYVPYARTIKQLDLLDSQQIRPMNQYPLRKTTRAWIAEIIEKMTAK